MQEFEDANRDEADDTEEREGRAPAYGRYDKLADFGALNPAEARVVEGVQAGAFVRFGKQRPAEPEPANCLRAEFVRYLARGGCDTCRLTEKGLRVRGAWIDGGVDLQGCKIEFPIELVSCVFKGAINVATAETRDITLNGSRIIGERKRAIHAAAVRIDGSLNMRNGFHALGEVRLAGAQISGMLACMGGRFENPGGYSIYAAETQIGSNVYLRDGFISKGNVSFFGAEIGRELQCWGGKFVEPDGRALSMRMVKIGDTLRIRPQTKDDPGSTREMPTVIDGALDLRGGRLGALEDAEASWPKPGNLRLDGLVYDRFDGVAPVDAETRGRWLRLQRPEELAASFRPQPFEQLMSVLRAMGHPEEARRIGVQKQRQLAHAGKVPLYLRPAHWLFGVAVGYGYWTSRALLWGLLFMIAGHFIFAAAWRAGAMAPTDGHMLRSPQWLACADKPNPAACWAKQPPGLDYEVFSPTLYSIDVFLPIVEFGQESAWSPSAPRGPKTPGVETTVGALAWVWRTIQEAMGYLLSAFAVAGGARLARREE
ncbi:MAG: hypothetical protein MRY74_15220 [Neomegalonema sp.]|nr:hypothetical protein [Neomegalonema sp.]